MDFNLMNFIIGEQFHLTLLIWPTQFKQIVLKNCITPKDYYWLIDLFNFLFNLH